MQLLDISTLLLASFCVVFAAPTTPSETLIPPSEDQWYTSPHGYEFAKPGDILRIRPAPGNLTTIFSNSSATYHVLYRTPDSHFHPFWAVTTLLVPRNTSGSALVSYQIPYNTADVDGSASVLLYAPVTEANALTFNDIQTLLGNGWHVNVPDYNGPLTSFGCGAFEGMATLDSIRAAGHASKALAEEARIAM